MDAQIKKGVLDMCILLIIKEHKRIYGYTLIKEITKLFSEVSDSTVYTILRRLNKSDDLAFELKDSTEGPKRKYYYITPLGEDLLEKQRSNWKDLISILDSLGI